MLEAKGAMPRGDKDTDTGAVVARMRPVAQQPGRTQEDRPFSNLRMPTSPDKLNPDRRHHIPKQKHKVTNGREYDASLRQRVSLTVRFTDEAMEGWRAEPRMTPGGRSWRKRHAVSDWTCSASVCENRKNNLTADKRRWPPMPRKCRTVRAPISVHRRPSAFIGG